jgi:hypothetical protein
MREQFRHKLLSRYRAHGLLGIAGGGDIFGGLGPAKPNPELPGHPGRTARGTSSSRRPSAASAGTCCRSSSATASLGASSRGSITPSGECTCSASGGRTDSRRAAPTGSSTRCAQPFAPTSTSLPRAASNGHPTSERRNGSSSLARDETIESFRQSQANARSSAARSVGPPCVAVRLRSGSGRAQRYSASLRARLGATRGGSSGCFG